MGQYYVAVILSEDGKFIRLALSPHMYGEGAKLVEHSYANSGFVQAVEHLLSPKGMFYKSRVVWAGDYADPEPESETNLYGLSESKQMVMPVQNMAQDVFILNHTKKQYIDKSRMPYHPLPLLTAEGNGRGGGDYRGNNEHLCGSWARDVISVEPMAPADYNRLEFAPED
jgi:hypothetical protein